MFGDKDDIPEYISDQGRDAFQNLRIDYVFTDENQIKLELSLKTSQLVLERCIKSLFYMNM